MNLENLSTISIGDWGQGQKVCKGQPVYTRMSKMFPRL